MLFGVLTSNMTYIYYPYVEIFCEIDNNMFAKIIFEKEFNRIIRFLKYIQIICRHTYNKSNIPFGLKNYPEPEIESGTTVFQVVALNTKLLQSTAESAISHK